MFSGTCRGKKIQLFDFGPPAIHVPPRGAQCPVQLAHISIESRFEDKSLIDSSCPPSSRRLGRAQSYSGAQSWSYVASRLVPVLRITMLELPASHGLRRCACSPQPLPGTVHSSYIPSSVRQADVRDLGLTSHCKLSDSSTPEAVMAANQGDLDMEAFQRLSDTYQPDVEVILPHS